VSGVAGGWSGFHLRDKSDETFEAFFARSFVAGDGVGGIFAGTHEAVARTVVCDGFVFLTCGLHGFGGGGQSGSDACVVAGVEAVDRSGDGSYV